jgi:hypothetical protein
MKKYIFIAGLEIHHSIQGICRGAPHPAISIALVLPVSLCPKANVTFCIFVKKVTFLSKN